MRLPKLFVAAIGMATICQPVFAYNYTDGSGIAYSSTRNKDGVVLSSRDVTIYLGNSCDAFSPQYGKGKWGWANGGVLVELKKGNIGFPRQESPFDDSRCGL